MEYKTLEKANTLKMEIAYARNQIRLKQESYNSLINNREGFLSLREYNIKVH